MSIGATLLIGILLGMRHALDADHLAAVATLVTRSRSLSHVHIEKCQKLQSALPGSIYIAIAPPFALPVGTHTGMHSSRKHFHQHRQYLAMVACIEAPHRAREPGEVQGDLVRST